MQASLERVGLDASKAIARARSRSVSRVGRKRQRDTSAAAGDAMEVDGSQAPEKKRIHSAKSRCCVRLHPFPARIASVTGPVAFLCPYRGRPPGAPVILILQHWQAGITPLWR